MIILLKRLIFISQAFVLALGVSFCSDPNELSSIGLKATDTIALVDSSGGVPAALFLRGAPTSTSGGTSSKTLNVPFDAEIDLNRSPQAYSAIQWGIADPTIALQIVFIDIKRQEHVFTIDPPLQKGPNLTRITQTKPIPLALEDIAKIILKVDNKEVAFYPSKK